MRHAARLLRPCLALALAVATVAAARRLSIGEERPYDLDVVPSASVLRWLAMGHPTLVANAYWLSTVQYIGEPRADARGWDKLLPLADLVTDLDPGHGYAYQVAGTVLSGLGRVEESNAILEKGTRLVPNRYILPYLRAFNAFFHQGDWTEAGRWAEAAARAPGAPQHVRQNVLAYYVKGRHPDAALAFLEEALRHAQDDESRKAIEKQILQARLEQQGALIDAAVAAYRQRYGVPPLAVPDLVARGFLARIPPDPFGGTFFLGEDGRARSTVHPYRLRPAPRREELGAMPSFGSREATSR